MDTFNIWAIFYRTIFNYCLCMYHCNFYSSIMLYIPKNVDESTLCLLLVRSVARLGIERYGRDIFQAGPDMFVGGGPPPPPPLPIGYGRAFSSWVYLYVAVAQGERRAELRNHCHEHWGILGSKFPKGSLDWSFQAVLSKTLIQNGF